MMGEQLRVEDEILAYQKQQFDSLERQLEHYQTIVQECIHQERFDQLIEFINNESEPFIFSASNNAILDLMLSLEQLMKKEHPEHLATIYLNIGHCFYFYLNIEDAQKYFKLAASYAMEYQQFAVLSLSLNNYNVTISETCDDKILWESSKYPSVFWMKHKGTYNKDFLNRFIGHIELSLKLGKNDYAYQIYKKYFEQISFQLSPRFELQLKGLKGDILTSLNKYDEALALYHDLLKICVKEVSYRDFIAILYDRITTISRKLNDAQLSIEVQKSYDQFIEKLAIDKAYLQKHLAMSSSCLNFVDHNFPLNYEQFIVETNEQLSHAPQEGLSVVIIDLNIREANRQLTNEILYCVNEKIQDALGERLLLKTRIDETTIGYLVRHTELGTEVLSAQAFQEVRELYPKETSPLTAIYFAAVNNVENHLTTYEQCRKLAYAYIYYEFYK